MSENKNFLDPKMISTLVLIGGFWMAWSYYMDVKYPKSEIPTATTTTVPAVPAQILKPSTSVEQKLDKKVEIITSSGATAKESFIEYSSPELSFQISSLGMGIRNIDIKKYKSRDGQPIVLGRVSSEHPFSTYNLVGNRPVDFNLKQIDENSFRGTYQEGSVEITKTIKVHPETYSLEVEVDAKNLGEEFKGLITYLSDLLVDQKPSGFMSPPIEMQQVYFLHDNKQIRETLSSEKALNIDEKNISILALDLHYFSLAIAENSEISPNLKVNILEKAAMASGALVYSKPALSNQMKLRFTAFAGPKSFDILTRVDGRLGSVVDYGMFAVIARPLLSIMKFFNGLVHNYGLAIILLTLLVRALVMPFNIYSFKSMKVMQKLQPEMKALREKFKDDPATQNAKVMELMKVNKANPLGGCLPMLLQLPVFFALYQTLGQSIELYREPFGFWIHDLSFRDPYFVLPVLMGITMFIQQKITPSNMDPQQAKIMMFMPIMFSFFMVSLPSGLTLYIFVSTLFGITQQYLFLREKTPNHTQVKQVQA